MLNATADLSKQMFLFAGQISRKKKERKQERKEERKKTRKKEKESYNYFSANEM